MRVLVLALVLAACADDTPPVETSPLPPPEPVVEPPEVEPLDEEALLGGWACENGIDPEIDFRMEDGERIFAGYLHRRPSHTGTWHVHESTLTIETDDGMTYLFPFAAVNGDELVLEGPAVRWACTRIEG